MQKVAEPNTLLLVLLFLAVAAGWVLGRGAASRDVPEETAPPSQYYLGLNFLLDGEQESALKAFSEALAVNAETFETHITFGSLLRKRGERWTTRSKFTSRFCREVVSLTSRKIRRIWSSLKTS